MLEVGFEVGRCEGMYFFEGGRVLWVGFENRCEDFIFG